MSYLLKEYKCAFKSQLLCSVLTCLTIPYTLQGDIRPESARWERDIFDQKTWNSPILASAARNTRDGRSGRAPYVDISVIDGSSRRDGGPRTAGSRLFQTRRPNNATNSRHSRTFLLRNAIKGLIGHEVSRSLPRSRYHITWERTERTKERVRPAIGRYRTLLTPILKNTSSSFQDYVFVLLNGASGRRATLTAGVRRAATAPSPSRVLSRDWSAEWQVLQFVVTNNLKEILWGASERASEAHWTEIRTSSAGSAFCLRFRANKRKSLLQLRAGFVRIVVPILISLPSSPSCAR